MYPVTAATLTPAGPGRFLIVISKNPLTPDVIASKPLDTKLLFSANLFCSSANRFIDDLMSESSEVVAERLTEPSSLKNELGAIPSRSNSLYCTYVFSSSGRILSKSSAVLMLEILFAISALISSRFT